VGLVAAVVLGLLLLPVLIIRHRQRRYWIERTYSS
jgi:hypothetical protein